jgi:hypothetical protein
LDCWHCHRNAIGVCKFCGRGICENHVKTRPFIVAVLDNQEPTRAIVVEDALHCGACHPRPDPIELPELD